MAKRRVVVRKDGRATKDDIIQKSIEILATYSYPITIRQMYYRLVSIGLIENNAKEYARVKKALGDARKDGTIKVTAFADPTRRMLAGHDWLNPQQYMEYMAKRYYRDPWQDQQNEVHIVVEKDAVASVFQGPCSSWSVPLWICRGYPSISLLHRMAQDLSIYGMTRKLHIGYFGDHDPSGVDIDRNMRDEIDMWKRSSYRGRIGSVIHRVAVTTDMIEDEGLIPMPEKPTDSRTLAFIDKYGENMSVELDALEPSRLETLINGFVQQFVNVDQWNKSKAFEAKERAWFQTKVAPFRQQYLDEIEDFEAPEEPEEEEPEEDEE